jgi:hypothetical protein
VSWGNPPLRPPDFACCGHEFRREIPPMEHVENASAVRHGSEGRPPRLRAAVTNRPLRRRGLDSRSRTGRRRADLITLYSAALGGQDRITEGQLADIVRAAELVAVAEEARFAALTKGGGAVDLVGLVRIEGAADRAVRRLGIKVEKPRGSAGGLAIARARWEEQRAQEQAKKASVANTEAPPDDRAA